MEIITGPGQAVVAPVSLERLGVSSGFIIQEFGYDDDVDDNVRLAFESASGEELVDEDFDEVTDGALLWWRLDDGDPHDLADLAMDAMATLDEDGLIWVLTPRAGRSGHVPPADVQEATRILGKNTTSSIPVGSDWVAFTITSRKGK